MNGACKQIHELCNQINETYQWIGERTRRCLNFLCCNFSTERASLCSLRNNMRRFDTISFHCDQWGKRVEQKGWGEKLSMLAIKSYDSQWMCKNADERGCAQIFTSKCSDFARPIFTSKCIRLCSSETADRKTGDSSASTLGSLHSQPGLHSAIKCSYIKLHWLSYVISFTHSHF